MEYRQKYNPNVKVRATRGWCLKYVDDGGKAPKRTATAKIAYDNEKKARRIKTSTPPNNVWVVGFLSFTSGIYVNYGHVFYMKYKSNGKYEIRDSETNSGARSVYTNINSLLAWFGAYNPKYIGWSTHCDGRQYAESYTPRPKYPLKGKTTAYIAKYNTNVRNAPKTSAKISGSKLTKKGKTFWAHSVVTGEKVTQNGVTSNKWLKSRWGNYTWAGNYRKK